MKKEQQLEELVTLFKKILSRLNVDLEDPNFKDTPLRAAKVYQHFFRNETEAIDEILTKVFPSPNKEMVIVKDIEHFGLCPHHLLPIVYKTHIGYIPNGKVLGLSKLARLAVAVSSYPKLQEDVTHEIAEILQKGLKPTGVMVVVEGVHGCMRCRGVEMDSATVTSAVRGSLKKSPEARAEFLSLVNK